jgi:hypothetical protein
MKAAVTMILVLVPLVYSIGLLEKHNQLAARCGAVLAGLLSIWTIHRLYSIGSSNAAGSQSRGQRTLAKVTLIVLVIVGVVGSSYEIVMAYRRSLAQ